MAANELAQEANDLFHQQERRGIESHDVHWDGEWISPGVYRLRNDGTHTAHEVRVTAIVDEEQMRAESARVDAGDHLALEFPQARIQYHRERRGREEAEEQRRSNQFPHIPAALSPDYHYIAERVYWRTELGTSKEHASSHNLAGLGDRLIALSDCCRCAATSERRPGRTG